MTIATVQRGRIDVNTNSDGGQFNYQVQTAYFPGDQVDLSDDEISRLIALGILADPTKIVVEIDDSGAFQIVDV